MKINQNVVFEKKKKMGWRRIDKKIDWNTSSTKGFYIIQNQIEVFKKKKVMQLIKSINYWELAQPTNQSTIMANTQST